MVNAVGQVVYKSTIQPARQSTIDVALPESVGNGIYLLKLRIGHEAQVIRFMVSR